MKLRTTVRNGYIVGNHNEALVVRTGTASRMVTLNHNETMHTENPPAFVVGNHNETMRTEHPAGYVIGNHNEELCATVVR